MPKAKNSYLTPSGDRTVDGWVSQAQAPIFGEPFKFGSDLRFSRKPPTYLTELQLRSLAYLDPAAAAVQTALRMPQRAPIVHTRVVRHGHGSLDGTASVPPPRRAISAQRRRGSGHGNSQNVPPPAVDTAELYASQPPMGATVSRAPVVLPHGRRVTKATGLVLREWGSLYPQAWAPSGAPPPLMTSTLPPSMQSVVVVERLDAADGRRTAASGKARRRPRGHPDGCRCASCNTYLVNLYASSSSEDDPDDTPGPGQYDVATVGAVGRSGPSFTIRGRIAPTETALTNAESMKVPGPGAYDVQRPAADGPAFTIKGRPRAPSTLPDDMPGPGEYYDAGRTNRDGPAFTLGLKAKRKFDTDAPGPGHYVVDGPARTGPAITIAARPRPRAPEPTPGPQDYQQQLQLSPGREGPAFTIYGRLDPKPDTDAPAPGEYDLPTAWRTGPAMSFAGKPAPRPEPEPAPGPGQYHVPPRPGVGLPAYTFGARPPEAPPDDLPGPGAYHRPAATEGPAFTIAGRPASPGPGDRDGEQLPGPGAYHPDSGDGGPPSPTGPAYTFGARPPERSPPASPGPGAYRLENHELPGAGGPAFTLAGRPVPREPPDSPGPAAYRPTDPALSPGPAFTMGTRPVDRDPRADLPAPGDYDGTAATQPGGPAYSMRGRPAEERRPDSPGPGDYHSPAPRRGPAFTMASRPSSPGPVSPDSGDMPGPGQYDVLQQSPLGPAYSMPGRPATHSPPQSPGPGEYERPSRPSGPAFSLRGKPAEAEPQLPFVGPGAYDPEKLLPGAPAFTLRGRLREVERPASPGPGEYDVASDDDRGPAWTMGARPTDPRDGPADGPAPGSYDLPTSPRGPAYTIRGRPEERGQHPQPGPGEYSAPPSPTGPAYSFRARPAAPEVADSPGPADYRQPTGPGGPAYTIKGRHDECKVTDADPDIPGPGFYGNPDPDALGRSGPAFTLRPRTPHQQPDDIPGPGEYGSPGGPSGPAYTMAGRRPSPGGGSGDDAPGPGAYSPGGRPDGPAFTMAPRVRGLQPEATPAPGDYGALESGPSGPAWSLSQRTAEPSGLDGPGPGEYYSPPAAGGPAYTMGAKIKNRRHKKRSQLPPEPGQYWNPPPPAGPAWTIGARPQGPTPYKPEAGPGDYDDHRDLHTGPAWTLRPRTPGLQPDPVPGPGTYNDAKPFPNPLGTVISRPRAHTERDPVYLTDMGGPYGDTMSPRMSLGRPGRKVTFHEDTMFRDSSDPAYGGRLRLEATTVSGPGGATVPPPRGAPQQRAPAVPPRESGVSAGSTYPGYMQGMSGHQGQQLLRQPQQQQQFQGGARPASQERQLRRDRERPQAAVTAAADARDAAVERAMYLLRQDALEQRYLGGGGGAGGGGWERYLATAGGGSAGKGPGQSPNPAVPAGQQGGREAGYDGLGARRGAGAAGGHAAGQRLQGMPDTSGPAPTEARPITHQQQKGYVAEVLARRAASERNQADAAAAVVEVKAPVAAVPAAPAPTAAALAAAAKEQQAAARQALVTAAAEGRTAPGLGGPPAMAQGPMGLPVAKARRRLDLRGPGGPSGGALSPREAALARAAAYMSGRGTSGILGADMAVAGARAPVVATGGMAAAPAAHHSVAVQAAPEHAPPAPRVMSAPAGRIDVGRAGSRGRIGSGKSSGAASAAAGPGSAVGGGRRLAGARARK